MAVSKLMTYTDNANTEGNEKDAFSPPALKSFMLPVQKFSRGGGQVKVIVGIKELQVHVDEFLFHSSLTAKQHSSYNLKVMEASLSR